MMINHNTAATNASRHIFNTNLKIDQVLERLSSGLRINSAADDASGLAIARKMEAQNRGLEVANQNAQDGLALYKIAEGALSQVGDMLARMEELATRAINGTLTESDRSMVKSEIDELLDQINLISKTTEYNTVKLLDGTLKPQVRTAITAGTQDSLRLTSVSSETLAGTYAFSLTAVASAAAILGTGANSVSTVDGVITVNGIDVVVKANDTVQVIAAKINAINSQTKVLAVATPANSLTLVSGVLDDDAKNIPGAANAIGYALVGSQEVVRLSGNATILGDIGIAAGEDFGANAAGNLDGTRMWSYGTKLKAVTEGARSYGVEMDVDLYNGGTGIYVLSGVTGASAVQNRSTATDTASLTVNTDSRMRLQIGANYNQSIYDGVADVTANKLGIGGSSKFRDLSDIDLSSADNANFSLKVIQKAIVDITAYRAEIGALMNRLDYTVKTVQIQRENMMAAQSRIEDADMAAEMTKFTKNQILLQAGTAMLAQANARPQQVLQLLQGQ